MRKASFVALQTNTNASGEMPSGSFDLTNGSLPRRGISVAQISNSGVGVGADFRQMSAFDSNHANNDSNQRIIAKTNYWSTKRSINTKITTK